MGGKEEWVERGIDERRAAKGRRERGIMGDGRKGGGGVK